MHIALCFDNNFIMQAGVTIKSVCLYSYHEDIVFHLFTNKISNYNKDILIGLLNNCKHQMIFYEIDECLLTDFPEVSRYPKTIYYRFFIVQNIPETVKYILYLDCDIVVTSPLRELYNTDLDHKIIAAVFDQTPFDVDSINRLKLPIEKGYFNSGVLLIDVQQWKEKNITSKLCKFIHDYSDKLVYPDQDALNYLFCNNWKKLHIKFNLQQGFVYEHTKMYWPYLDELHEAQSNPVIIHFSGIKPWKYECCNPYKQLWLNVVSETPWRNYLPQRQGWVKKLIFEIKIFLLNHIHVTNERKKFSKYCHFIEER